MATSRASEPSGSSDAKTASSQWSRIQPLRLSAVSFDTLTTPCENGDTTNIRPALIASRYSTGTLRHIPRAKTITTGGPLGERALPCGRVTTCCDRIDGRSKLRPSCDRRLEGGFPS